MMKTQRCFPSPQMRDHRSFRLSLLRCFCASLSTLCCSFSSLLHSRSAASSSCNRLSDSYLRTQGRASGGRRKVSSKSGQGKQRSDSLVKLVPPRARRGLEEIRVGRSQRDARKSVPRARGSRARESEEGAVVRMKLFVSNPLTALHLLIVLSYRAKSSIRLGSLRPTGESYASAALPCPPPHLSSQARSTLAAFCTSLPSSNLQLQYAPHRPLLVEGACADQAHRRLRRKDSSRRQRSRDCRCQAQPCELLLLFVSCSCYRARSAGTAALSS